MKCSEDDIYNVILKNTDIKWGVKIDIIFEQIICIFLSLQICKNDRCDNRDDGNLMIDFIALFNVANKTYTVLGEALSR